MINSFQSCSLFINCIYYFIKIVSFFIQILRKNENKTQLILIILFSLDNKYTKRNNNMFMS